MHITIERLRTLVLGLAVVLVVALVGFLVRGRWKSHLSIREIPKRLGVDIKQQANEIVYTQSRGGHALFKLTASKEIQLKKSGQILLQHVQIELYGQDGSVVDRISGDEFQYDQKAGRATAAGPVEIVITRPANLADAAVQGKSAALQGKSTALQGKSAEALARMAQTAAGQQGSGQASGQIDVKTSGLVFDQKSGTAITQQRVEFSTVQGSGSSVGATFDSDSGYLVLDRAVELNVRRGEATMLLRAEHAEVERGALLCRMRGAAGEFRGAKLNAGQAQIHFREDGTVARVNMSERFDLASANGSHISAPTGWLEFNEDNEPTRGRVEGGLEMQSSAPGRQMRGTAPSGDLAFAEGGHLRSVHLERGVDLRTDESSTRGGVPVHTLRHWTSPVMDAELHTAESGELQLTKLRGTGGVVVSSEAQQLHAKPVPSRMAADTVDGKFAAGQLSSLLGEGHAQLQQTTSSGAKQSATGNRIEARFIADHSAAKGVPGRSSVELQAAALDGDVTFEQQAAGSGDALHGTAAHAAYDGASELVRLTGAPRVEQGGMQMTADEITVGQQTQQAFAKGNVKATWTNDAKATARGRVGIDFGGSGPAHVVADEATLQQSTGEAVFQGASTRLWQGANSISAPIIVLNRTRQTLTAQGIGAGQPVRLTLLSAGMKGDAARKEKARAGGPSVVRVRAGELKYSEAERKADLRAGPDQPVTADTGTATTSSNTVEIVLLPAGNHAGADGHSAQVDRMIAKGNVVITSGARHGTGEQLVYSGETDDYVLTGTAAQPPKMTDPEHGSVTGASLSFNSRDDSVSIDGGGRRSATETTVPR